MRLQSYLHLFKPSSTALLLAKPRCCAAKLSRTLPRVQQLLQRQGTIKMRHLRSSCLHVRTRPWPSLCSLTSTFRKKLRRNNKVSGGAASSSSR